jgi:hypothetical protein
MVSPIPGRFLEPEGGCFGVRKTVWVPGWWRFLQTRWHPDFFGQRFVSFGQWLEFFGHWSDFSTWLFVFAPDLSGLAHKSSAFVR